MVKQLMAILDACSEMLDNPIVAVNAYKEIGKIQNAISTIVNDVKGGSK